MLVLWFIQACLICVCYSSQSHPRNPVNGLGFGKSTTSSFNKNETLVLQPPSTTTKTVIGKNQTTPIPNFHKIVGGIEAEENEYPFIVSLSKFGVHFCGGSIIGEEWIITAAHCVKDADFDVIAGEHDFHELVGCEQKVRATKVTLYPSYNPVTFEDDIALVRVDPAFTLNKKVAKFNVPNVHFVATGSVTTAGWGVTEEGSNTVSPVLRKVTIPLFSNMDCVSMYGSDFHQHKMICAGESGGGKDSCQGDSGGPLMCDDHFNGATLCGIVSFGFGCARPEYAGVYTKVAHYADWISWVQNLDDGKPPWTTPSTDKYTKKPQRTMQPKPTKPPKRNDASFNNCSFMVLTLNVILSLLR